MADLEDVRLADELLHSAERFELTIDMDKLLVMRRKWLLRLLVCLEDRVALRDEFRTHYYVENAWERIRELEIELGALLRRVAYERPTRN